MCYNYLFAVDAEHTPSHWPNNIELLFIIKSTIASDEVCFHVDAASVVQSSRQTHRLIGWSTGDDVLVYGF